MLLTTLDMTAESFDAATGWAAKPEGMCKGDACVPAPGAVGPDGTLDVAAVADRLGMALVADESAGVWALGPESGGKALDHRGRPRDRTPRPRRQPVQAVGHARSQGPAGRLGVVVRLFR